MCSLIDFNRIAALTIAACSLLPTTGLFGDEVEFLSGSRIQGTVKEIRAKDREFDVEIKIGSRTVLRTYPFAKVHAVTMKGKRYVLTPMAGGNGGSGGASGDSASSAGTASNGAGGPARRTEAQVKQLIAAAASPPPWLESTPLDYPKSLDLSWPLKPPQKGWNNQRNMGQYIWDIIHPNPNRWRSGIKLVHHCMTLHKDDPTLLKRDMEVVGRMYFELLQDYPRAAFWMQRANVAANRPLGVSLAECYWRMGSKSMALQTLKQPSLPIGAIKLFGDMGELDRALALTKGAAQAPNLAGQAYLLAADALRRTGRHDEAITYYEKVVDAGFRNKEYQRRFQQRAKESIEAIRLNDRARVERVADGKYEGVGEGYNGALRVSVSVQDHKITDVQVVKHQEKQFYAAITDTTSQIVDKQAVTGIDATSRATITSQAIINASAKALASGAK